MPIRVQRAHARPAAAPLDAIDAAWLRRLFARAVRGSLLGSLALAGCGGDDANVADASDGGARPPLTSALRCPGLQWELADGFALAREVDYLADRDGGNSVLSELGSPCTHAENQERCIAAYEVAVANFFDRHLLTTERDVVNVWRNPAVLDLFGAIDTPHEALWLVGTSGYNTPCGQTHVVETADGFEVREALRGDGACPSGNHVRAVVLVDAQGELEELSFETSPLQGCSIPGRRPAGLRSSHRRSGAPPLGEHFAAMAHMEAASAPAFAAIARELAHHGAPRALRVQAERSRRDELRHARTAAKLARRFGGTPRAPWVQARPVRALEAFALDNAVEGCVHETYAALEASHQAAHARDRAIARALAGIAGDETRHAALSWQIHAWVMPRLGARTQQRVRAAQRAAVDALAERTAHAVDPQLCQLAGLPDATAARALHACLADALWRA